MTVHKSARAIRDIGASIRGLECEDWDAEEIYTEGDAASERVGDILIGLEAESGLSDSLSALVQDAIASSMKNKGKAAYAVVSGSIKSFDDGVRVIHAHRVRTEEYRQFQMRSRKLEIRNDFADRIDAIADLLAEKSVRSEHEQSHDGMDQPTNPHTVQLDSATIDRLAHRLSTAFKPAEETNGRKQNWEALAVVAVSDDPTRENKDIASEVGIHPSQLSRSSLFQEARARAEARDAILPRKGTIADGKVDGVIHEIVDCDD